MKACLVVQCAFQIIHVLFSVYETECVPAGLLGLLGRGKDLKTVNSRHTIPRHVHMAKYTELLPLEGGYTCKTISEQKPNIALTHLNKHFFLTLGQ